jgi:hypothetical protein
MKPISSVTIGIHSQGLEDASSTGNQPGGTGSAMALRASSEPDMPRELVEAGVAANTKNLLSQLLSFGVHVTVKSVTRFPTDQTTGSMTWKDQVVGAKLFLSENSRIGEAKMAMRGALAPAPAKQIERWVTLLALDTNHQNRGSDEFMLMAEMWTRRLREFPGDVVFETLTNWRQKWFPAWTELVDVLEEKTRARRFIALKLEELP